MQMYNHLANVPPPGVNSATPGAGTAPGPQYPSRFLLLFFVVFLNIF
jgi:hypothetical protein